MVRFDLVIANRDRIDFFWEGFFKNVRNFRPDRDRIIIMDCSDDADAQLKMTFQLLGAAGFPDLNVRYIKRRNWNYDFGAKLDYIRYTAEGLLDRSQYSFFMQEHYFNTERGVRNDSLPEGEVIDLDAVEKWMIDNPTGVYFCSRLGFRILASVGDVYSYQQWTSRHDDGSTEYYRHPKSQDLGLAIDGGNLCTAVGNFFYYYFENKERFTEGTGDYYCALLWEARFSKILSDQGLLFYEQRSKLGFRSPKELKERFPVPGPNWTYWLAHPPSYLVHGRDMFEYEFIPEFYAKYYSELLTRWITSRTGHDTNTNLHLLWSSRSPDNQKQGGDQHAVGG